MTRRVLNHSAVAKCLKKVNEVRPIRVGGFDREVPTTSVEGNPFLDFCEIDFEVFNSFLGGLPYKLAPMAAGVVPSASDITSSRSK
jgi:hypothetical protein